MPTDKLDELKRLIEENDGGPPNYTEPKEDDGSEESESE